MDKLKNLFTWKRVIYIFIIIYFILNLIYLTTFPFVHSDEPWLSGLSRNILENRDFSVTETFFDLYERHPHGIKFLFHSIQIFFMIFLGYNIFTFRFISLVFAMFTLLYFYKLCLQIFNSRKVSILAVLCLALDIQFIYGSHFARQEIVLLFISIFAFYYFFKNSTNFTLKRDIILGILIGLAIGIHPNSFIISLPFIFIYIYQILITKESKIKNLVAYIGTLALFAALIVLFSLHLDSDFLYNYPKYGDQFGVLEPVTSKFGQIKLFYLKLFYGVSGTYYTPNIKFQFFLFSSAFILTLYKVLISRKDPRNRKIGSIVLSIIAINLGLILVGRYNQTSIIFIFPLCYILVAYIVSSLKKYYFAPILTLLIAVLLLINTLVNVVPYTNGSYDNYLKEIGRVVESDDSVLANLNSEYYFENGKLFDYRNLSFLRENNLSFRDYIYKNNIEFIIYPEEMDFIYSSRPLWNGVYGNLANYYEDMKDFLEDDCTFVYEFNDSTYGIRIARYIGAKDWNVKIYRVKY